MCCCDVVAMCCCDIVAVCSCDVVATCEFSTHCNNIMIQRCLGCTHKFNIAPAPKCEVSFAEMPYTNRVVFQHKKNQKASINLRWFVLNTRTRVREYVLRCVAARVAIFCTGQRSCARQHVLQCVAVYCRVLQSVAEW